MQPVTSLFGPTHGCAYLVIVLATWRDGSATTPAKILALLPGIGGSLVLGQLNTEALAEL